MQATGGPLGKEDYKGLKRRESKTRDNFGSILAHFTAIDRFKPHSVTGIPTVNPG